MYLIKVCTRKPARRKSASLDASTCRAFAERGPETHDVAGCRFGLAGSRSFVVTIWEWERDYVL
jgi:hypothetical protein